MKSESLFQYIEAYLGLPDHPDYGMALNGVQVEGPDEIHHVVAAVDASESVVNAAAARGAHLLLVHHGLFWEGLKPLTGRRFRKIKRIVDAGMAVFSAHLPLDSHGEVGNCVLLARALGVRPEGRVGSYEGADIGWWGVLPEAVDLQALSAHLSSALDGSGVHVIAGGPDRIERVGVLTGGGGSFVQAAVDAGLDAFVTGEGSHHTHIDAMELGMNVLFGGHYATETFGVKALAAHLAERFGLTWEFVDQPTGL